MKIKFCAKNKLAFENEMLDGLLVFTAEFMGMCEKENGRAAEVEPLIDLHFLNPIFCYINGNF